MWWAFFGVLFVFAAFAVLGWIMTRIGDMIEWYPKTMAAVAIVVIGGTAVMYTFGLVQKEYRAYTAEKKALYYRTVKYPQYAKSKEGMMSCVQSFNKQSFLAPAWKKSLPKGTSATVDVYQQVGDRGASYFFLVPELLKKQSVFWSNADVPHFMKYKGDGPYYSIDEAHFQKGQYRDIRYRFSAVACNPISSGRGDILSAPMYYIVFDGSLTAKGYEQYRQKLRASGFDHNKAGIRFKMKHLGEGELFTKSRVTSESPGMEKVYSIKL